MRTIYNPYIVFVLGMDNFEISKLIRENEYCFGADEIYDMCIYLATKFDEYDNNLNISEYEALERFLCEYNDEIMLYYHEATPFNVIKKGDS